eukprot:TRINITY_DN9120_c0_g1_i1.p1 TRINITY_DN9120_c0_g1~~TRINITY_DN9120_c0_g1_i1.p1  ORF type:complete len:481 (-),score=148.49 TRINITY_DN9120_c0_g1_i1:64-1506(-)
MLSRILSQQQTFTVFSRTNKSLRRGSIQKRQYAKEQQSEAAKFLSKAQNKEAFEMFLQRFDGEQYPSLEAGVEHYFGGMEAKQIEQTFNVQMSELQSRALARDLSDDFYKLDASQKAMIREFYAKEVSLRDQITAKYGPLPTFFKANLGNEMLAGVNEPIRVAITGAAGAIGYSLAYRIASGNVFGPNTPVILQLLELPQALGALEGVVMELNDCAFPLLHSVVATDNAEKAFEAVDYALLVGSKPRGPGMERADLLQENAKIFKAQGAALNKAGKGADTRVLVVGNPANTNALIAKSNAKNIPAENFSAMTRLDHNRGVAQLAQKLNVKTTDISKFAIWGNHSATQFPDVSHAIVGGEKVSSLVSQDWLVNDFIPVVQQRGAAIIKARGASSAASAASAALDAVVDIYDGTFGEWTSHAVCSNGEYGITPGIFYSYPVTFERNKWSIVEDLPIDEFARNRMEITHKELLEERDAVAKLL